MSAPWRISSVEAALFGRVRASSVVRSDCLALPRRRFEAPAGEPWLEAELLPAASSWLSADPNDPVEPGMLQLSAFASDASQASALARRAAAAFPAGLALANNGVAVEVSRQAIPSAPVQGAGGWTSRVLVRYAPLDPDADHLDAGLWAQDYAGAPLSPAVSCVRASGAGYVGSDGNWHTVGANVVRHDPAYGILVEPATSNKIRNNKGTGGTPTNFATQAATGLAWSFDSVGTAYGASYVRYRLSGTATGTGVSFLSEEGPQSILAGAVGTVWTLSRCIALAAGSLANVTAVRIGQTERASSGLSVSGGEVGSTIALTNASFIGQRYKLTHTITNALCVYISPNVQITTQAGPVNITIDIALGQLEPGSVATTPIETSGSAGTRAADVITHAGMPGSQGSIVISARTAPYSGTQTYWSQGGLRIWRDSSNVMHATSIVDDETAADLALTTVANDTAFTVEVNYDGTTFTASCNNTTNEVVATAPVPAEAETVYIGSDAAGRACGGWIALETLRATSRSIPVPWAMPGATASLDFGGMRFDGCPLPYLSVARTTVEYGYDRNGADIIFPAGVPACPTFDPNNGNAPMGLFNIGKDVNWLPNSGSPVTQTVTPLQALLGALKYYFVCEGPPGSYCELTIAGVTTVVYAQDPAKGFPGYIVDAAHFYQFNLDGVTPVTVTVHGAISYYCLGHHVVGGVQFPGPKIITPVGTIASRDYDQYTMSLVTRPGIFNGRRGTIACRFYIPQLIEAGSFVVLSDGTVNNRLAANFRNSDNRSGVTVVANGETIGGWDPPGTVQQGYNTFVYSYDINDDGSGVLYSALNGSAIDPLASQPYHVFGPGQMPTNLNKVLFGNDEGEGEGINTPILNLKGGIVGVETFPLQSLARTTELSAAIGPFPT